jgi:Polymer-forming cytoskeletal
MFELKQRGRVIAEGLKIVGNVTAEELVEINGQVEGELYCTSLIISRSAHIKGPIQAEQLVVDGTVEGPVQGGNVVDRRRMSSAILATNLLPLRVVPSSMVVRCRFGETGKRLKTVKGSHRDK